MNETIKTLSKIILTDINGKALLYAIPLFLTPFVDKLGDSLLNDQWPSLPKLVGCTLLGVVGASIGLRAFFDGSYQRKKTETDNLPTKQEAVTAEQTKI